MKASQLARMLEVAVRENGDFDVIAAEDAEGNGYNDVRGVDIVFQNIDDPELIYNDEAEAQADCELDEYEPRFLIYV